MEQKEIQAALTQIDQQADLNATALLMAGLVSELFREQGFEPVVVGGSAIEFYTDGAYMSGDTDICWTGVQIPNREECLKVMEQIPDAQTRGGKSWQISGLWVDLLGEIDYLAEKDFAKIRTPLGFVVLIPVEDLLVGRIYAARKWTGYNAEDDACAKKLMTVVLSDQISFDWPEAIRIAASSKYRCESELLIVREEVQQELARSSK